MCEGSQAANVTFSKTRCGNVLPLRHDPVTERACRRFCLGPHYEACRGSFRYVEGIVVLILGNENVVGVAVHDRTEVAIELYLSLAVHESADTKILKPALWALHAIEPPVRPIWKCNDRRFSTPKDTKIGDFLDQ